MVKIIVNRLEAGRLEMMFLDFIEADLSKLRQVKGRMWHPDRRSWSIPCTNEAVTQLTRLFPRDAVHCSKQVALQARVSESWLRNFIERSHTETTFGMLSGTIIGKNPGTNPRQHAGAKLEADLETNLETNLKTNLETNLETNQKSNLKTNLKANPRAFPGTNAKAIPEANRDMNEESFPSAASGLISPGPGIYTP